jgi:hypothetical protein
MSRAGYQKHNTYSNLKTVVLGSFYSSDYFKYIQHPTIRSALTKIADEINHDLDYFETFLKKRGVNVVRPGLPSIDEFYQHIELHHQLPIPPLQPRNNHSVIGRQLYKIQPGHLCVDQCLIDYDSTMVDLSEKNLEFYHHSLNNNVDCSNNDIWYCRNKYQELAGPNWPDFYEYVKGSIADLPHIQKEMQEFENVLRYNFRDFGPLDGPNIFPTDHGVVVDSNEYCNYSKWAQTEIGNYNYISVNTGAGHTDGCFNILGHNTILGIGGLIDYQKIFPNHTVISVPDESYINHVKSFAQIKNLVGGRWWVDGQENNIDFINFIETYCKDWTGFVEETVFDINVLAIDPDTVCVSGSNPDIEKKLADQGIESILIPWRHGFFVDGGLHCITLDLYRD